MRRASTSGAAITQIAATSTAVYFSHPTMSSDDRVYAISNQVILWTVLSVVFALIIWKLEKPRAVVAAAAGSEPVGATD